MHIAHQVLDEISLRENYDYFAHIEVSCGSLVHMNVSFAHMTFMVTAKLIYVISIVFFYLSIHLYLSCNDWFGVQQASRFTFSYLVVTSVEGNFLFGQLLALVLLLDICD